MERGVIKLVVIQSQSSSHHYPKGRHFFDGVKHDYTSPHDMSKNIIEEKEEEFELEYFVVALCADKKKNKLVTELGFFKQTYTNWH